MQLGARVASATSDAVTHVVAASNETDKAHWARKRGRHLVSPGWLHAAGILISARWLLAAIYVKHYPHATGAVAEPLSPFLLTIKITGTCDHGTGGAEKVEIQDSKLAAPVWLSEVFICAEQDACGGGWMR